MPLRRKRSFGQNLSNFVGKGKVAVEGGLFALLFAWAISPHGYALRVGL